MIGQTRSPEWVTEPSIRTVIRAIRLGIKLWINEQGKIKVSLPFGIAQVPSWLRRAKDDDECAFGLAVAMAGAVERSGGDPEELLRVTTIVIEGVQ